MSPSTEEKSNPRSLKTGLDLLIENQWEPLWNQRIAVLTNHTSVDRKLKHLLDHLNKQKKIKLKRIFAPEHGLDGFAQDMEAVGNQKDQQTGIPILSLYGEKLESLAPNLKDLNDIDTLLVDLPDIGTRYYTYYTTMAFCMRACAKANVKVMVLDRPNPIGATQVEGTLLNPGFESFVGAYPLPIRHGLTLGELALWLKQHFYPEVNLQVVTMENYQRQMKFSDTNLLWILPSPNMPNPATALIYPGMCLFEATEISEGRGTTQPFHWVGAPFIDSYKLKAALDEQNFAGVLFKPITFKPGFQKWAGQICFGISLHVTDENKFHSVATGMGLLATIYRLYPNDFKWRQKAYEFVDKIPAIDLLTGSSDFRLALENGDVEKQIQKQKVTFEIYDKRKPQFLYEE